MKLVHLLAVVCAPLASLATPAHAANVAVSCLAGHDGSNVSAAIQIRRVRTDQSFNVTRLRAYDENGGLVADRSGAMLNAVLFTALSQFGGTTVTTLTLFGTRNVGRLLIRLDITDTRAALSDNAPFLIQAVASTVSPATRFATYCDGGGFDS